MAVTTFIGSKYSFGNLVEKPTKEILPLAVKTTSNLSFGTGYECTAAVIGKVGRAIFGSFPQTRQQNRSTTISTGAAPRITLPCKKD